MILYTLRGSVSPKEGSVSPKYPCIDAELAKGDLSEYAKGGMLYNFVPPMVSHIHPVTINKLDFLKVFKEFVINGNEEILPDDERMYAYLKRGCKLP